MGRKNERKGNGPLYGTSRLRPAVQTPPSSRSCRSPIHIFSDMKHRSHGMFLRAVQSNGMSACQCFLLDVEPLALRRSLESGSTRPLVSCLSLLAAWTLSAPFQSLTGLRFFFGATTTDYCGHAILFYGFALLWNFIWTGSI